MVFTPCTFTKPPLHEILHNLDPKFDDYTANLSEVTIKDGHLHQLRLDQGGRRIQLREKCPSKTFVACEYAKITLIQRMQERINKFLFSDYLKTYGS